MKHHPIVHEPPTLGGARAIIGALLKLAGLAILLVALLAFPSFAQQPGVRTLELNTFGRYTSFAPATNLEAGFGGGFRLGYFIFPRWELEGGVGFTRADRIVGSGTENVVPLLFDVTYNYPIGWYQLLLGGGAVYNKYSSSHAWGTTLSGGVRLAFGRSAALRVDGTREYLNKGDSIGRHSNWGLRLGLSWILPQRNTSDGAVPEKRGELAPVGVVWMPLLRESDPVAVMGLETERARRDSRSRQDSTGSLRLERVAAEQRNHADATIQFDLGSSKVRSDASVKLAETIVLLRDAPALRIRIEGRADVRGSTAYDITLAWDRAGATKVWLTNHGMNPDRIDAVGYSEARPPCDVRTDACPSPIQREFLIVAGADVYLRASP